MEDRTKSTFARDTIRMLLVAIFVPTLIVSLGMWRTYSTMDYVYAKQQDVYQLDKEVAIQDTKYDSIVRLLDKLERTVSQNHADLKKEIEQLRTLLEKLSEGNRG